jgi:O-methyltransferase involved in polyketide biosynthesis
VAETLLFPLYTRALEAKLPTPLVRDEKAVALVERIDYDFSRLKLQAHDLATTIMRLREFDQSTPPLELKAWSGPRRLGCGDQSPE